MDQTIIGSFKLADFDCPFSYEKDTEKITVFTGGRAVTIPENTEIVIGQKYGMLNGGYTLYKLTVPLSNDCMAFEGSTPKSVSVANQIRSVEYYIENYQPGSHYTELRLQFAELNYFIPSIGRATITDEEIVISRKKETLYSFDIKFRGTSVKISFIAKAEARTRVKTTVETISEVVLAFPETEDLEYVRGLYDVARGFFSFICNRRNIGLRSATLIGEYPTKRIQEHKIVDSVGYTSQNTLSLVKDVRGCMTRFDPLTPEIVADQTEDGLTYDELKEVLEECGMDIKKVVFDGSRAFQNAFYADFDQGH